MTLSKDATRKVDKLVDLLSSGTGYSLTRSQVVDGLLDQRLKIEEPKEKE
jgi:hypothetical protein